ncbi:MAG: hypothetical protein HQM04_16650 [Magnetococcales bacterium]|nr:hypothetical protein [Magnetococcales bacterium]MBF0116660.1 hypothetical protein [Magnetococcales bacterium]
MHNYLMLAPLILSRLRECLPQVEISSSWGVPAIKETPDQQPSIVVFLEDDQPVQQTAQGTVQKITQTWMVLVAVRDTEEGAGELISRVYRALAGWRPGLLFEPLHRVRSSYKPDVSPNGVSYFPLSFETSFIFNTSE